MPYRRMFSLPIIIRFNLFKNTGFGSAPCHVPCSVNEFDFQGVQEALRDRIIVAGGFAPHTTAQPVVPDQSLVLL